MPSGAKKRKAAKKKKEQHTNNSSSSSSTSINNSNPLGNDDPKSQDERDSDGGEVGSPASQDHHNQEHPFKEENEESEKRDQSSFVSEYKPVEGVISDEQGSQKAGVEDDTVVKIEVSEQDIEHKDAKVDHVEFAKESHAEDDKSSSSSSSDDESHAHGKKWKEEAHNSGLDAASCNKVFPEEVTRYSGTENAVKDANGNSAVVTAHTNDLAASQVPISEVAKSVMEGAVVENPEILDVIEPELKENKDKLLSEANDVIDGLVPQKNEDKAFPIFDEHIGGSVTAVTSDANGNGPDISGAHSTETTICAEKTKDFETSVDIVIGNEAKMLTSPGAHASEASKARDYETSEYTETQPLVPSAPQVTQRTSWVNCCGLFEVFTGSNR